MQSPGLKTRPTDSRFPIPDSPFRVLAPLLLSLASCATNAPAGEPVTVTLYGPEARLETWDAEVVSGIHTHGRDHGPCLMTALAETASLLFRTAESEKVREAGDQMAGALKDMCGLLLGPSRGGAGRMVLGLRHAKDRGAMPDEALLVSVPLLGKEEEQLFAKDQMAAVWERPAGVEEAALENGWVRVRRLDATRWAFELFLVLKPVRPGAGYERLQAVARGEALAR